MQIQHREAFLKGERLGFGDKVGVRCYSRSALVAWRSQTEALKKTVLAIKPDIIVTRLEIDAVDRRGRVQACWNAKSAKSWCMDSGCKAQLFYGRHTMHLREQQLHKNRMQPVRVRFRFLTAGMQMPSLGNNLSTYGSRDKGADQYWQMMSNLPRLDLSPVEQILLKPAHIELWCADRHGSNVNMFWIALREAVESNDRDYFIRLVRFCLQHGVMTSSGEGNFVLLCMLDVEAAAWQKRLYLSSAHLGGNSGRIHCDLQKLLDDGTILTQQVNFNTARGGLQALLKYCQREEEASEWKYWELTPAGELVFDVTLAEDELDVVYNAEKWAAERDKAAKNLHGLFSRPSTPAENKWFSNTGSSLSLLVFLGVEYNNGFKKWMDRDRVWIKSDFFDVRADDHDLFAVSMLSSTWSCGPCEKFSKRLLISKDRRDAKNSAECRSLLQKDTTKALKDLQEPGFELLARTVTPMVDHETAQWRQQLQLIKDACAWSIVCSQTTIVGRNIAMFNSADFFFVDYRLCTTDGERQELVDEMIDKNSTKPNVYKSNDFGPLMLYQICRCVAQYPRERRYEMVQKIVDAVDAEEEHTQRVESLHQTYLTEVENGGRWGNQRGSGRCGAVLCQKTLMHGRAENERRVKVMEVMEQILNADPFLLKQRAGQQAFNSHRLFPYQCFAKEMGRTYDFHGMSKEAVSAFILEKWEDPSFTNQQGWIDFSNEARRQAKTDAEDSVVQAVQRRKASHSTGIGELTENAEVFVPPRHLEHVTKYYEGITSAVREHWDQAKDQKNTPDAVAAWNKITNRELSPENPPLAHVHLVTEGPSLLTRRICWMGKKVGQDDQLWKRNKAPSKSSAAGGDEPDNDDAETAGLSTCPKPPERMSHLVVLLDATTSAGVLHNGQEVLVVTFSWSRPFSWVGRKLEVLQTDFDADSAHKDVRDARRSSVRHLPAALGCTGLKLDRAPSEDTIRSWLWSASQPRPHQIFPARLVSHPTSGDFFFEILEDAFTFAEHPTVQDICEERAAKVKTTKELQVREAKVVERKYKEIEKLPSLKRKHPSLRAEKIPLAAVPPLKKTKKAGEKFALVTADEKFAVGLESESQGEIMAGAFAHAAGVMGKMINIDGIDETAAPGEKRDRGGGELLNDSLDGMLDDSLDFSAGQGGSSSSAPKLPAGGAAASSSGGQAVQQKKMQKNAFLGAGGVDYDSFNMISQKVAKLETVGGGKWIAMKKKVEKKTPQGGTVVSYEQKRLCIELTGELKKHYLEVYDKLLESGSAQGGVWVQECAKSKALSFGKTEAAAFCRTWVRLMRCIVDSSTAFRFDKTFVKRQDADLDVDAKSARGLLDLETKLSQAERAKLEKMCDGFFSSKNFQTCIGFSITRGSDVQFIDEEGGENEQVRMSFLSCCV